MPSFSVLHRPLAPFQHIAAAILAIVMQSGPGIAQPAVPALDAGAKDIVPIAVFGADERAPVPQSHAAIADKIGVLALDESTFCTAFCIAGDVIVTASHCLLGTEQTPGPDLERVSFNVGHDLASSAMLAGGTRTAIRANLRSGTPLLHITPPIAAANDWAAVRLAKPICKAGGLPITALSRSEIEERAEQGVIYQIAMHRDVAPRSLVAGGPCGIKRSFPQASEVTISQDFIEPRAIFMHTCDTGPGSSGSPLLIDGAHGPEVVGLNVGTYVLSRTSTSTSSTSAPERGSQAIANTAIDAQRFKSAIEMFSLETSAITSRSSPAAKPRPLR